MESFWIHVIIVFFDTASWPTQNAQTDLFVSLQLICLPPKCACKIHHSQLPAGFFLSSILHILFLIVFHDNSQLTFLPHVQVNELHVKQLAKHLWIIPWHHLIGL